MNPPDIVLVLPTFNEKEALPETVSEIQDVLGELNYEIIVVDDDSPDGTHALASALARKDPRIRVIRRIRRSGLASACLEGWLASTAPVLAVMDADGQHDPAILPNLLAPLLAGESDCSVGSRYCEGGSTDGWQQERRQASEWATQFAKLFLNVPTTDPMSGFFALRRTVLDACLRRLSGTGFKILFDLLITATKETRLIEVPYQFRPRRVGTSKLDGQVVFAFLVVILDKLLGQRIPVRFVLFVLSGFAGALLHLFILGLMLKVFLVSFLLAQGMATALAILLNFIVNNLVTYRDRRLIGWRFWAGLGLFLAFCAAGATANLMIAHSLYQSHGLPWWVAGLCGAAVGAVWNFAVNTTFTWRIR